jgi:Flp pilus assembly protein TadD
MLGLKGLAYLRAGDRARSDAILEQLRRRQPLPASVLARWYAAAGNPSTALAMLERTSTGSPGLQQFKADPVFDGLRSDPRFADRLRRAPRR